MAAPGVLVGAARPRQAWRWFLVFEATVGLVYFPFGSPADHPQILGVIPWMEWAGQVPAWAVLGLSSAAAIFYGAHRYRPEARTAWLLLGVGVLLFVSGDTTYKAWHQLIGDQHIPFPSFVEAFYVAMYIAVGVGLMLLNRARVRGTDRSSLLDALMVTLSMALLSWTFLIGPSVRSPGSLPSRLTAGAYPLGDVLLLAMLAHLWSAGGLRNGAGRLLAIGLVGTLVADSMYGLAMFHTAWHWHDGNPFDIGWMFFYACWGAAALHPSMGDLSKPRAEDYAATGRLRLVLLALVSLIAPVFLFVDSINRDLYDAPVIAGFSGVMFVLVLLRMAGLVTRQQQVVAREQVLHRAAAELVAAPGLVEIYDAVLTASCELVLDPAELWQVLVAAIDDDAVTRVVGSFGRDDGDVSLELEALPAPTRSALIEGRLGRCVAATSVLPAGDDEPLHRLLFCPVISDGEVALIIVVKTRKAVSVDLIRTFEALSAQIRLALDRERLNEAFHARRSEARFQTLVQNASDLILIIRPDTTIVYGTPSTQRILGYPTGSLEGERLISLLHPGDVDRALAALDGVILKSGVSVKADWRICHRDGSYSHVQVSVDNLLADPTVEGVVVTMRDVTEQKDLEEELKHQAFHDALTGLPNRALFSDRLEHALERSRRLGPPLAVFFLDLDDFKLVNDSRGHTAGDELLVAVGQRLMNTLRSSDTVARFGGDEFAILLEDAAEASDLAERILADLQVPIVVSDLEVQIRASIGIALSDTNVVGGAELMQAADLAMYAAKTSGKGSFEVYHPKLQTVISKRLERTAELYRAVEQQQFMLEYQPIVSLDTKAIVGVEALIRWNHPVHGRLAPTEFIALTEETGLIIPVGRWALREACANAARWQTQVADRFKMSVNVSPRQFHRNGLIGDVASALQESGLDPANLVLEITESLLVSDTDAVITQMLELKLLGISFAVDDFGTGYSSLAYLKRFPIDILKVDKSFVDDVGHSAQGGVLAEAIVGLGRSLGLAVVAEGIEDVLQLEALRTIGCALGQGFYFARPMSARDIDRLLPSMSSGEAFDTPVS